MYIIIFYCSGKNGYFQINQILKMFYVMFFRFVIAYAHLILEWHPRSAHRKCTYRFPLKHEFQSVFFFILDNVIIFTNALSILSYLMFDMTR